MDYTTLARAKLEMDAEIATVVPASLFDTRLSSLITAASRAIDRKLTGVPDNDAVDYLKLETKTGEIVNGMVNGSNEISCYPHKPVIASVTSFEYRQNITKVWETVTSSLVNVDGEQVRAYPATTLLFRGRCQVRVTYSGGLASATASLPDDIQEAATILAIRYFKEAEGGLTDAIGVAELATMIYTKAWPVRVLDALQPFIRRRGWRHVG